MLRSLESLGPGAEEMDDEDLLKWLISRESLSDAFAAEIVRGTLGALAAG